MIFTGKKHYHYILCTNYYSRPVKKSTLKFVIFLHCLHPIKMPTNRFNRIPSPNL